MPVVKAVWLLDILELPLPALQQLCLALYGLCLNHLPIYPPGVPLPPPSALPLWLPEEGLRLPGGCSGQRSWAWCWATMCVGFWTTAIRLPTFWKDFCWAVPFD